jgi:bacteriocin-like protein
MSETKKQDPSDADETQELTAEELEKVSGGPTAVERMLLPAVKQGQVIPSDQFSLNFTKGK